MTCFWSSDRRLIFEKTLRVNESQPVWTRVAKPAMTKYLRREVVWSVKKNKDQLPMFTQAELVKGTHGARLRNIIADTNFFSIETVNA